MLKTDGQPNSADLWDDDLIEWAAVSDDGRCFAFDKTTIRFGYGVDLDTGSTENVQWVYELPLLEFQGVFDDLLHVAQERRYPTKQPA